MNKSIFLATLAGSAALLGACSGNNDFGDVPIVFAQKTGNLTLGDLAVTASSATSSARASALLKQDTSFFSATGAPLCNTNVTLSVEAYDGSRAAETHLPGGTKFTDPDVARPLAAALGLVLDVNRAVTIDSTGFALINIEACGVAVKQISPNLSVVIRNFDAASGTTVGIVSIDEVTKERRFEGTATINSVGDAAFSVDHLTAEAVVKTVTGFASGAQGGT